MTREIEQPVAHGRRIGPLPHTAVILAGGKGRRLYPFTASLPKPLLPLWDMPVVEIMMRNLAREGIGDVVLAINHLADLIVSYFGDGRRLGVNLRYIREPVALGTAGALSLLPPWTGDLLVTNGDVVTDIDISAMYRHHRKTNAAITIASITRQIQSDSGVLEVDVEGYLARILEKPVREERISIGIYVVAGSVRHLTSTAEHVEMPDLIERTIRGGGLVSVFEHPGLWLDIGRPEDLARAQVDTDVERIVRAARDNTPL
jgi:NDP-sugar pyrophosphorylase family protein